MFLVLCYLSLSFPIVPYFVQYYHILSYLPHVGLAYRVLPCLSLRDPRYRSIYLSIPLPISLSYPVLSYPHPVLSHLIQFSYCTLPYPILSYLILPYPVFSSLILSDPMFSHLILYVAMFLTYPISIDLPTNLPTYPPTHPPTYPIYPVCPFL